MARIKVAHSEPEFYALLDWLSPDRERAAEEYVRLHRRFVKMFESRGCGVPEDCADETFNRVGNHLLEGKEIRTNKPVLYLTGVARHILREQWSKPVQEGIDDVPPNKLIQINHSDPDEQSEKERRHRCLEQCLQSLPPESQMLLLEYYAEDKIQKIETRGRMAQRLGIAASVLRNRIFKLRNSLRVCLATCMAR